MTYNVPDIHMVDWKQVQFHPIALDVIQSCKSAFLF